MTGSQEPKVKRTYTPRQIKFFMYEIALCIVAACLLAGYYVSTQSNPYASCYRVVVTNQHNLGGNGLYPNDSNGSLTSTGNGWYCNKFSLPTTYYLCADKFSNCTNQSITATDLKILLQEELRIANESYNIINVTP
jgi:hypothetical protein